MRLLKIKVLIKTISKINYSEAIRYCRILAKAEHKDFRYAAAIYNTIKNGTAKIYFYEDGSWEYKRIK